MNANCTAKGRTRMGRLRMHLRSALAAKKSSMFTPIAVMMASAGCSAAGTSAVAQLGPTDSSARCPTITSVKFQLDIAPDGRHAPFYTALKKGYYAAACLHVTTEPGSGSGAATTNTAAGTVQASFLDLTSVLIAKTSHKSDPLVYAAVIYARPPYAVFSYTPGADITTPKDMVGKPIGCPSNSTICPLAASWFHKEGYGTLKFKYVPEADQFPLFRAGKVSSLVTYNLTQPLLESPGKRLNMVLFANYGMTHFYGNGIVLNSKWAARHATAAKAFVAATMNGFQYALTHPKAAVAIMTSEFPTLTASTALSQLRLEKGLLASAKAATMACIRNRFVASTVNFDIEGLKLPAADRTLPLTTDAYEPASCAS